MKILVIIEENLSYNEFDVIGSADSVENAEILIKKYYGDYIEQLKFNHNEYPNIAYSKILEIIENNSQTYKVKITLQWFNLNEM
jgi:hypothetical protein